MKTRKMSFRISEEDLEEIHRSADRAGLTVTEFITRTCLGKEILVVPGLPEVVREQKALGRNLNQLTTLANMGRITCVDLSSVLAKYSQVHELLAEIFRRKN